MIYEDMRKGCKHIKIKSDNTAAISYMNKMKEQSLTHVINYQKQYGITV